MVLNILRSLSVDFIHSELLYSPPFYVVTCHAAVIFCVVAALELKSRSPGRWWMPMGPRCEEQRCTGGREKALWLHRCRQPLFSHSNCMFSDDQRLTEGGVFGLWTCMRPSGWKSCCHRASRGVGMPTLCEGLCGLALPSHCTRQLLIAPVS